MYQIRINKRIKLEKAAIKNKMGLLNFLRINKEKGAVLNAPIRQIRFDELGFEIELASNTFKDKVCGIKNTLEKEKFLMLSSLKLQIEVLKLINLDEKRENEKLKRVVKENLWFYIEKLEKLAEELKKENPERDAYLEDINSLLSRFDRTAVKYYEKATIFIGKELEETKKTIGGFTKSFSDIMWQNSDTFIKQRLIETFRKIDIELKNEQSIKIEQQSLLEKIKQLSIEAGKQKNNYEKEYLLFKTSEEFKKALEEEQNLKNERIKINNEIFRLKESIGIRELLKYYYKNKKAGELLNKYKENFIEALENDTGLEIGGIVLEAKQIDINETLKAIKAKCEKLKAKNTLIPDKINYHESRINKVLSELESLSAGEVEGKKKISKLIEKENCLRSKNINKAKEIIGNIDIIES